MKKNYYQLSLLKSADRWKVTARRIGWLWAVLCIGSLFIVPAGAVLWYLIPFVFKFFMPDATAVLDNDGQRCKFRVFDLEHKAWETHPNRKSALLVIKKQTATETFLVSAYGNLHRKFIAKLPNAEGFTLFSREHPDGCFLGTPLCGQKKDVFQTPTECLVIEGETICAFPYSGRIFSDFSTVESDYWKKGRYLASQTNETLDEHGVKRLWEEERLDDYRYLALEQQNESWLILELLERDNKIVKVLQIKDVPELCAFSENGQETWFDYDEKARNYRLSTSEKPQL